MSQAHRPTWNPTQGRETKAGSQQVAKLSLPSYTKLKFRQPGQTSSGEVAKRDLRAELAEAERKAAEKKRKAAGLADFETAQNGALRIEAGANVDGEGDEEGDEDESAKRRKVLEEAADLDKDDESDDEGPNAYGNGSGAGAGLDKGKGKAVDGDDDDDDDDDDSDDDSDDEDETAALMAELAKIKQERAEEKARQDAEANAANAADRDQEIATGNPLLNLQNALGQSPGTPASTTASSTAASFSVRRRWDDDLIFKNQAAGLDDKPKRGEFVNDLLRSEFHKKFMLKFIK